MTAAAAERAVKTPEDVVTVRQAVRARAVELGFTLVDQTKLVTAASELARNLLQHAGGGIVRVETLTEGLRRGLRVVFEDKGPGIPDVDLAMRDGYSTSGGLGLGLSGARRLSNDFRIESVPGTGTRISIARWK